MKFFYFSFSGFFTRRAQAIFLSAAVRFSRSVFYRAVKKYFKSYCIYVTETLPTVICLHQTQRNKKTPCKPCLQGVSNLILLNFSSIIIPVNFCTIEIFSGCILKNHVIDKKAKKTNQSTKECKDYTVNVGRFPI